MRVPWTASGSNQSILKEINPELEGLMLKLKLQYHGHLMQRANSLENWERLKTLRRSNQSTLKEIKPEYSLEGLMLKLQYFGHLM